MRTHIVGTDIAGLSAALAVLEKGGTAVVYDTHGPAHIGGPHLLFRGDRQAMAFLKTIGTRVRWAEPKPAGILIRHGPTGQTCRGGLSPWTWLLPSRRPHKLGLGDLGRVLRLTFSSCDRPAASLIGERPSLSLLEPLALALLNMPAAHMSSQHLGRAFRRLLRPGASKVLIAREDVERDLIEPALGLIRERGAGFLAHQNLRSLLVSNGRAIGLVLRDRTIALGPADRVVLALPPWDIANLLPDLPVPGPVEAVLNIRYPVAGRDGPRLVGFAGRFSGVALIRPTHVSVMATASLAEPPDAGADDPLLTIWREIAPILTALGLKVDPDQPPGGSMTRERRAAIHHEASALPGTPVCPLANVALAGAWVAALPPTIESAVRAGIQAASALDDLGRRRASASSFRKPESAEAATGTSRTLTVLPSRPPARKWP